MPTYALLSMPKWWDSTREKHLSLFQVKTLRRFQRVDSPSSGPVPAFWGAYRRLRQYRQRRFATQFAVVALLQLTMNRMMMMQGGHRCLKLSSDRPNRTADRELGAHPKVKF